MEDALRLIAELCEAHGPSGYEGPVREVVRRWIGDAAEISQDRLGSLVARREGDAQGPRIMLAGHLDEIGFLITRVDDDGFLFFQTIGGWWEQVMLAQRVAIRTRRGSVVTGVIGSKPPHVLPADEARKPVEKRRMFIDIGARSREEVLAAGVRPGDPAVPVCPTERLANPEYILGKAWDDRYGCAVLVETMRGLQGKAHPNVVYGVATVQEEVGLRGARTSAQMIGPDVAIALDVGIASDTPGMKAYEAAARLGRGPAILLYDGSLIPNQGLRQFVEAVAEEEGIPYQHDTIAGGGTDAGAMQLVHAGVPSICIGVPTRYIHSAAAVFHEGDFRNAVRLIEALLLRLDRRTVDGFTA